MRPVQRSNRACWHNRQQVSVRITGSFHRRLNAYSHTILLQSQEASVYYYNPDRVRIIIMNIYKSRICFACIYAIEKKSCHRSIRIGVPEEISDILIKIGDHAMRKRHLSHRYQACRLVRDYDRSAEALRAEGLV